MVKKEAMHLRAISRSVGHDTRRHVLAALQHKVLADLLHQDLALRSDLREFWSTNCPVVQARPSRLTRQNTMHRMPRVIMKRKIRLVSATVETRPCLRSMSSMYGGFQTRYSCAQRFSADKGIGRRGHAPSVHRVSHLDR